MKIQNIAQEMADVSLELSKDPGQSITAIFVIAAAVAELDARLAKLEVGDEDKG